MIVENLIANFEISKEDDYGFQQSNLLIVRDTNQRFSKMNTHEPTTIFSQLKRDSQLTNNISNNENGVAYGHRYKKTMTSASLESNVFVKGNLVFATAAGGSHQSTPRRYADEEENTQKIAAASPLMPIFQRDAIGQKKISDLPQFHEKDNLDESTNEKIQDLHSNSGSGSPNSNQAMESNGESAQAKHNQSFEYEKADSNQAELRSSMVSQNESQFPVNRSHLMKSRFSKTKPSISGLKKDTTSFSNPDDKRSNSGDSNHLMSPKSLEDIQPGTQVVLIQSNQLIPPIPNKMLKNNSSQETSNYEKPALTPAQRRKSQLHPVSTNKFQTLAQKKREEFSSIEPSSPFSAKEKFKIAGTVARTLSRLQVNQVSRIESQQQLEAEFDSIKVQRQSFQQEDSHIQKKDEKTTDVNNAFNQLRMVETITEYAESGNPEDVNNIISVLQKDPKKYIRSTDDPQHILNKLNSKNQNAAYIACKNGNLNIVQFLVKQEININIKSRVGGEIEEFPLQVAVRWNYKEIVDFLLNQKTVKLSQQQISAAYDEAKNNKSLRKQISLHLKKKPFFLCC